MSTLTGNKISLTYKSLIKTADNDVLSGALKQLSDGLGNNSGVYLNTGGDLKSTGTLEFANFKGTSTAVTINKLVNEADGISNNDNDTSLPTSAAVKDYVDTHVTTQDLDFSDGTNPGAVDLDSQVFAIVGTSNEIETSASGQQLQIGLPDDVTISGTYTGATFSGDLSGTINTVTTATTQTAGDNSTKVATTAYVDTLDAASDLDFSGDSGTGDVNLNTQSLAVTGTANQITTAASNQGLEISLLSTGVTMPDGSVATTQTAGDNSTKLATTAYVDTLDAASDLDITDGTNTSDINLNTESLSILGTANEIVSTVSAQTATISLPSTINVNVTGNVTGDLTGNADTATAWQTARDLSLTSEATGTISSVDGSGNVSGAVTLLNSAVTAKVLTGLPTPAAGNIEPSDTILEAFGKVQSQINSISSGLVFKGSWDAATNTPTLTSGGGEVDSGTTDGATTAFKLIDSSQNFNTTVSVGNKVINQVDGQTALVTVIDSNTQLTLDADIMLTAEAYTIDASPFISQGQYYVVNFAGTTNLNGINNWSIGDWVIADANNEWSKLDHSQIDGQGTTGNLPVFTTANTIGDSIVSESGTALTVTGSLTTTLGLSSTGDFAVNTDKFTVNATSGNISVGGTGTFGGSVTGTSISDGFITMGFAQINRNGAAIELQYAGSANSLVQIGGGGSNPITFNANTGNATFAGSVTVNGNATLGDGTADNHTINGQVFHHTADALGYKLHRTNGGTSILISATSDAEIEFGIDNGSGTNTTQWTIGKDATDNSFRISNSASLGTSDTLTLTGANATFAGDVGIGGSPSEKLSISDTGNVGISINNGTHTQYLASVKSAGGYGNGSQVGQLYLRGQIGIGFSGNNGGATHMTIDSSGNVGIGVTPYSYSRLTTEGSDNTSSNYAFIAYQENTNAILACRNDGQVTIPSGNLIASGDVYINNTLPRIEMQRSGSTVSYYANASGTNSIINGSVVGDQTFRVINKSFLFSVNDGASATLKIDSSGKITSTGASEGVIKVVGSSASHRAEVMVEGAGQFTASFVAITGSAPAYGGIPAGTAGITTSSTDLVFATNSTERMRITSGGDVFIADDQNSSAKLYVKDSKTGSESSPHFQIKGNGYDAYHYLNTTAYYIVQNSAGRSIRIVSNSNGVKLDPGATAWTSNSDIALKENIKPLENVLDKIKDYRCVEYNLKTDEDKKIGFIAQDWENDFAPIVNKEDDGLLGMKYTETIPVLLKAIQELKAEVDKLKQECKCK